MAKRVVNKVKSVKSLQKADSYRLTKILITPVVIGLIIMIGFPEIVQFVSNTSQNMIQVFNARDSDTLEKESVNSSTESTAKENDPTNDLPPEIKNFKATYQTNVTTKKIFLEGRRIAPVELLPQTNISTNHSVRVYMFDDFLSPEECDGLRNVHDKHIKLWSKEPPILCFESLDTLKKNLYNARKSHIKVSSADFTSGTFCLNTTFSLEVAGWLNHDWSYSTAFYPNETSFSKKMAALIQETTGLKKENGGKFQITSYPLNVGYKKHTDCMEDTADQRDRMATVLVYLDDVESGGETSFPELGIWVKPRKGRALVWNNMNEGGECDPVSIHQAKQVIKGHKYIIQRWYYYKSFWSLGRRVDPPPRLPERSADQARVSCDEYKHGSCRWYDEWTYDVLRDYHDVETTLI